MATLGSYTLLAAFVACAYAAAAAVAGHRRHSARLLESGIGAFYLARLRLRPTSMSVWVCADG